MNRSILWVLAVVGTGCATNLSTLQTGKTLQPGQFRLGFGTGVYLPAGQLVSAASEGFKLAKNGVVAAGNNEPLVTTSADDNAVITAATAAVIMPVANLWEINARLGVFDDLDVGARFNVNAVRLDAKYRLYHGGDPEADPEARRSTDVSLGVGVSRYLFNNPLVEAMYSIELRRFDRWDVEVPLYVSHDFNTHFGLYFAPKYVYSYVSLDGDLVATVKDCGCYEKFALPTRADMHFFGATAGLRAGGSRVSFFAEITAGQTIGHPVVLGKVRDLGGVTLYPSIGIAATFW